VFVDFLGKVFDMTTSTLPRNAQKLTKKKFKGKISRMAHGGHPPGIWESLRVKGATHGGTRTPWWGMGGAGAYALVIAYITAGANRLVANC
jgi:hypothetical protein